MIDRGEFRDAMTRLGAAVNLITTDGPAGRRGFTASAVCSVTDDPPTLLVCVNRSSESNRILKANGVLCVNILASRHVDLSHRFSQRGLSVEGRFGEAAAWKTLMTGAPVLGDAAAALDCEIAQVQEVGSHSVIFCHVLAIYSSADAEGLIYFARSYHPVSAPTAA